MSRARLLAVLVLVIAPWVAILTPPTPAPDARPLPVPRPSGTVAKPEPPQVTVVRRPTTTTPPTTTTTTTTTTAPPVTATATSHAAAAGVTVTSTAYCLTGTMANGQRTYVGAAAGNAWPLGTRLRAASSPYGPGFEVTIADRSAPGATGLDFAMPGDCGGARSWGRRAVTVEVLR